MPKGEYAITYKTFLIKLDMEVSKNNECKCIKDNTLNMKRIIVFIVIIIFHNKIGSQF